MPESAKEKISMFSHVDKDQVICLPDVNNIYQVPLMLYEHNLAKWFAERLSLKDVTQGIRFSSPSNDTDYLKNSNLIMQKWSDLAERLTLN
jgi:CTP synthase (UTP-ammonia lyase)